MRRRSTQRDRDERADVVVGGRAVGDTFWVDMGHSAVIALDGARVRGCSLGCLDAGLDYRFGVNEEGASGDLGVMIL